MNSAFLAALTAVLYLLARPVGQAARQAKTQGRAPTHIEDSERNLLLATALGVQVYLWWHEGWPYNAALFLVVLFCNILVVVVARILLVTFLARWFKFGPESSSSHKTENPANDSSD